MEFYPKNIDNACNAEKAVWEKVKNAFNSEPGVAFHRYQLFDKNGNLEREIDILIVHPQLGLWIIECKGCYINNIESIKGCEWNMKTWYQPEIKPLIQAQDHMFALKKHLRQRLDFCNLLSFNFRVAIPFINQEQWQLKGFHNLPHTQGAILIKEDLEPDILKNKLTTAFVNKKRLTEEQWYQLICIFGLTNQTSINTVLSSLSKNIILKTEEFCKTDDSVTHPPVSKIIELPCRLDKQPESQPVILTEGKKHELLYQSQVNQLAPKNIESQNKLEVSIDDKQEFLSNDSSKNDEFLETTTDNKDSDYNDDDAKFHYWKQTQKKHYTEDSIRLYLQEIARIPMLRANEEIELARKITDLLDLERVREKLCQQLDRDPRDAEWAEAVQLPLPQFRYRLHVGRRAKDKMVRSNLRLVVSIAKKYMNRGLSFQDLIQEGNLGLIRAAEKFDHEKGYKFSTYATWWIRQAITRAIADQSRTIRLPIHVYESISRIKKTCRLLSQEIGRKPTEAEISEHMEMTVEKLRFIARLAQLPISLETPIYIEKDPCSNEGGIHKYLCLADIIEADEATQEEHLHKRLLREDLEKVLDSLSPRERDVIRLRYGFDDGRMKTLEEIGQIFNVTRERIRQIEAKALRKLRHPNRNSVLKEYIYRHQPDNLQESDEEEESVVNQDYICKQQTRNANDYIQIAIACHKCEDFLGAIENFTQALKLNPSNAHLYYFRGLAETKVKYYQGAIEDFTQAISLNPQYIDAYYQRGHIYYSLGGSQKAIEDYRKIISLNPNEVLAYLYRGIIRNTQGQIQAAIDNYNQALYIKPDFTEAYLHRGISFDRLGDLYRAIENYNQALRIYPEFTEVYGRRGLAYHRLGNYQEALKDYSQVVLMNPEDAQIYYYRGLIYENLSEYLKALEDYDQALKINPAFAEVYHNRGSILYNLGNYQEALENLNALLRINPDNAQAYNQRSTVRAALKDYQGAMEDLQCVAKIHYSLANR